MDPSARSYPEGWRDSEDDPSSHAKADPAETFFIRQEPVNQRYFDVAGLLPNITRSVRPALLVSDDHMMAIEECQPGAEAKNFFAIPRLVDAANEALRGPVRLRTTNRHLMLGLNALYEVEPVVAPNSPYETRGLDMRSPQKCNLMAGFLTDAISLEAPEGDQLKFHLAAAIDNVTASWFYPGRATMLHSELVAAYDLHRKAPSRTADRTYWAKLDEVETKFYALSDELIGGYLLRDAMDEIGRGLIPRLGHAIVVWSAASEAEFATAKSEGINPFPYHFATVVASSGEDYVTLENYERREASNTDESTDPLFFFQMYSTSAARPEQSWQRRQAASPGIIGRPVSFQWQRERRDDIGL